MNLTIIVLLFLWVLFTTLFVRPALEPIERKGVHASFNIPLENHEHWEVVYREGWYELKKKRNGVVVDSLTWNHNAAIEYSEGKK